MLAFGVAWWGSTLGMGIQPQKEELPQGLSALVHRGSRRRGRRCPGYRSPPGKHTAGIASR